MTHHLVIQIDVVSGKVRLVSDASLNPGQLGRGLGLAVAAMKGAAERRRRELDRHWAKVFNYELIEGLRSRPPVAIHSASAMEADQLTPPIRKAKL